MLKKEKRKLDLVGILFSMCNVCLCKGILLLYSLDHSDNSPSSINNIVYM